jgi:hypothetical protein
MHSLLENREVYQKMFGGEVPAKIKEKDIEEEVEDAEKRARQ